jgi:hypothetical protein
MATLRKTWLAFALAVPLLLQASAVRADEYDPKRAGHPLRILAYALYPVGYALDHLLMRPAHWVVMHEPFRSVFGHEDD